jgi:hypothetical protein
MIALLTVFAATEASAGWTYAGVWPDTSLRSKQQAHAMAVSPDGRIWIAYWNAIAGDSLRDATDGLYYACRAIYVFNPNGTQAPFSPIRVIQTGTTRDTLWAAPSARSVTSRGMRADHQGNILFTSFDQVFKINYQTGVGISKVRTHVGLSGVAVGVDTLGEVFAATVAPGNPIKIYDASFNFLGNVTDTSRGFSRTFEVSKDGNYVYWMGYTTHAVFKYFSPNGSFGPYVLQDTVLKGMDIESCSWNPTRTRLWVSAGSRNDRPNQYPGVTTNYDINTWYAWNPATTNVVTDSIKWNFQGLTDTANYRPRSIAFSPDGLTAYVGIFGSGGPVSVEKFTFTSDVKERNEVPEGFTLEQNYPNPFNPTTEIRFSLVRAGMVTLKVYDMLGREVNTLVSDNMNAGSYSVPFSGAGLSSGTYVYILSQDGNTMSRKMLLVK